VDKSVTKTLPDADAWGAAAPAGIEDQERRGRRARDFPALPDVPSRNFDLPAFAHLCN